MATPPKPHTLRIMTGNLYFRNKTPSKAVSVACGTKAHSIGFAEGSYINDTVARVGGRNGYVPIAPTAFAYDSPVDARDCPMLVHKSLVLRHQSHTQVCDRVIPHAPVAHERTFSMIVYEAPFLGANERVAHIAIHPNWVEGIGDPKNPVVTEYIKALPRLDAMINLAKTLSTVQVVTGDLNSRIKTEKRFPTVYDVFRDQSLSVKTDGLDGAAWSKRLKISGWDVIDGSLTGADHPWLVADFSLRSKK